MFKILAKEWVHPKQLLNPVVILLHTDKKQIQVNTQSGKMMRAIDFNYSPRKIELYLISDKTYILIRRRNEYDLVTIY